MAAYITETQANLPTQITQGSNIDLTTATQIANFLAVNNKFATPQSTVNVEYNTYFSGLDATTGVDVYEVTGTQNINYSTGQNDATAIAGNIEFNTTGDTLPTALAVIMANTGADTINIDSNVSANYLLATGSGDDFINMHQSTGNDTILTGAGNDSITLGAGHETVYSGTGNDTINASAGTNTIYGYSSIASDGGNDTYNIYGGTNTITTSDGNNQIYAFSGHNTINVGNGNDTITLYGPTSSSSDTDVVHLGGGADSLTATGAGSGSIYGGTGADTVIIDNGGSWTFTGSTMAGAAADTVAAYSGTNSITAGSGGGEFDIWGGTNTVTGGSGTDQFNVNTSSAQTLVGGSHYDLFNLNGTSGAGTDTITGGSGYNYTNVNLTSGSVSIDGSASANNTVAFTQFAAGSENGGAPVIDSAHNTATYTWGSGSSQLTVVVGNQNQTIVKFQ